MVNEEPAQMVPLLTVIVGCALTFMFNTDAELVPHALFAVTEILPLPGPTIADIVFVELVPLQPPGKLQL